MGISSVVQCSSSSGTVWKSSSSLSSGLGGVDVGEGGSSVGELNESHHQTGLGGVCGGCCGVVGSG